MHAFTLTAVFLLAGVTALPLCNHKLSRLAKGINKQRSAQPFFVDAIINAVIRDFFATLPDPLVLVQPTVFDYPLADIRLSCSIEGLTITGASKVVVSSNFVLFPPTVNFVMNFPELTVSGDAVCDIHLGDTVNTFVGGGSIAIEDLAVATTSSVVLIPTIQLVNPSTSVTIGGVNADVQGTLNGVELLGINELVKDLIPELAQNTELLNQLGNQLLLYILGPLIQQ